MKKTNKRPAKIMEFMFGLGVGGMEKGVVELVLGMDRSKFTPIVCCLARQTALSEKLTQNGIKIYYLSERENPELNFKLILKLAGLLRKEQVSLVHTHNICGHLYGLPAAFLSNTKAVHSEHGFSPGEKKISVFLRWLLSCKARKIVTRSQSLANEIKRLWHVPNKKLYPISSGINASKFNEEYNRQTIRQELGFNDEDFLIGLVARLELIKDHETLIKSVAFAIQKVENLKLVLVGDGSLKGYLKSLSSELGISDNVVFLGHRSDIAKMLSMLDLFVLTSKREGTSTAIMEAMAMGLPVIATDVGGNPELIQNDYNGLLTPPGEPDTLGKKIIDLISNSEKRFYLGTQGKEVFYNNYTIEIYMRNYQNLFAQILN